MSRGGCRGLDLGLLELTGKHELGLGGLRVLSCWDCFCFGGVDVGYI